MASSRQLFSLIDLTFLNLDAECYSVHSNSYYLVFNFNRCEIIPIIVFVERIRGYFRYVLIFVKVFKSWEISQQLPFNLLMGVLRENYRIRVPISWDYQIVVQ